MEQLTKVRVRALVVGIIAGLIVVPVAMFLRDRKFVNRTTNRYAWCYDQLVYVSLTDPPAPNGTFPDTFEICTNNTVTWKPSSGEPITKFVIDFDYGETPFSPDQGHFEWSQQPGGPDHVSTSGAKDPCLSGGCTYVFFGSKYFKYRITVTAIDPNTGKPVDHKFDPGGRISK